MQTTQDQARRTFREATRRHPAASPAPGNRMAFMVSFPSHSVSLHFVEFVIRRDPQKALIFFNFEELFYAGGVVACVPLTYTLTIRF